MRPPARLLLTLGAIWACGSTTCVAAQEPTTHRARFAPTDSALSPGTARTHLLAALAESQREPLILRDTVANAVLAVLRRRADSFPPEVTVTMDSLGQSIAGYIDLSADGSYTGELHLRIVPHRSVVLGVITRHCDENCVREFELAVAWGSSNGSDTSWTLQQLARREADGQPVIVASMPSEEASGATASATPVVSALTLIRGVVRDEKGRPVPDIEVFSADAAASVLTDANGAYRMAVPMPPGGVLLSTRRIGWAPSFRTVLMSEGATVEWNPTVKSTTVLAKQLVTATGVPDALRSFRYNDFLTRRARGVGQFFMTDEIWSAMSLGDVLNRGHGISVSFGVGNNISVIRIPSCSPLQRVGVYIDGINETNASRSASQVLSEFVSSAIVAMEVYTFRSEIPGEFARPEYCAVIALWTR